MKEFQEKSCEYSQGTTINLAGSVDKSTNALTIRLKIVQSGLFTLKQGQGPDIGARFE